MTLRVAASSAPSTATSGLSSSYSSGVTPVPPPMTVRRPGQGLDVVVAPVVDDVDPSPGADGPGHHGNARRGPAPGPGRRRQDARADGHHLGGQRHVMSATRAPAKAGFDATRPSPRPTSDGVTHQSRVRGGRGARPPPRGPTRCRGRARPTAPSPARRRRAPRPRPRRRRNRASMTTRSAPAAPNAAASGTPRAEFAAVGQSTGTTAPTSRPRGARRRAEELVGHPWSVGLDQDGDDPGGTPVSVRSSTWGVAHGVDIGLGPSRRRRHRVSARTASATTHGDGAGRRGRARSGAGSRPTSPRPTVGLPAAPQGPAPRSSGTHAGEPRRRHGGAAVGGDLARLGQPLGGGEHRRELDLDVTTSRRLELGTGPAPLP